MRRASKREGVPVKTLTLLRHAKSGAGDLGMRDFDRPLNAKGARAAEAVGRYMRGERLRFDHVLASPAMRVTETLDHVVRGYGETLAPHWDRRVYLASAGALLELIHALPEEAGCALIVGHNPGLEDLVLALVPDLGGLRYAVEEKFPTASLAELRFDAALWDGVRPGAAKIARFVRPRDLDPAFGPDFD